MHSNTRVYARLNRCKWSTFCCSFLREYAFENLSPHTHSIPIRLLSSTGLRARMKPPSRCPSEFQEFALDAIDYRNKCVRSHRSLGWWLQPDTSSCRISFRQDLCLVRRRILSLYIPRVSPSNRRNNFRQRHMNVYYFARHVFIIFILFIIFIIFIMIVLYKNVFIAYKKNREV